MPNFNLTFKKFQKTFNTSQKWRIFAKSGHTDRTLSSLCTQQQQCILCTRHLRTQLNRHRRAEFIAVAYAYLRRKCKKLNLKCF